MTSIDNTKMMIEEANSISQQFHIDHFSSADGTIIKFGVLVRGLGVIILAGGLQTAQDYFPLASHLADRYPVYATDRRGGMAAVHRAKITAYKKNAKMQLP